MDRNCTKEAARCPNDDSSNGCHYETTGSHTNKSGNDIDFAVASSAAWARLGRSTAAPTPVNTALISIRFTQSFMIPPKVA
jgi:hypothetical protein